MRKLEEKRIREGGKLGLRKSTVESSKIGVDCFCGILNGAAILSYDRFNNCCLISLTRTSSNEIKTTIPKVVRDLTNINDNDTVSIFEDNHDIFIIPTSREKEILRELGVKLY